MGFEESDIMEHNLRVDLRPSAVPIVDCEIKADARLIPNGSFEVPQHSLSFNWYREQSCFVHRFEVATIQCMSCVTLKIPIKESYYCSTKCFLDTWKSHRMRHQVAESVSKTSNADDQASGILRSCGSWPCAGSWSAFGNGSLLDGTAMVVEREGKSWIMVGSSNTYFPSIDDYGFRLRLESAAIDCTKGSLLAPINIIVTDLVVVTPILRPRCMIQIGLPKEYRKFNFDARPSVAGSFSVLSYNVLSDIYANTGNHSYCPKWALTWEYRRQNLLYEITGYEADILCLQEVQNDHFENFFEPELVKRGYSVIYKKRNKEVFTISGGTIDGCATCFRHDRFKEIIKYELEFERNAASMVKTLQRRQNSNDDFRLMKDNVAIVVVLERKTSGAFSDALHSRICVANTHIHANKDLPDVKLWQVTTLINGLESIVQSDIPLLICGDLNSVPGSAPHTLLVKGKVDPNHEEMAIDPLGILPKLNLHHSLPLVSAYSSLLSASSDEKQQRMINPHTREPLFTNLTPNFSGTLDYIFYTENSLKVEGLLELLDLESTGQTALPSPQWSSDHIALMASFSMAPNFHQKLNLPNPPSVFPW